MTAAAKNQEALEEVALCKTRPYGGISRTDTNSVFHFGYCLQDTTTFCFEVCLACFGSVLHKQFISDMSWHKLRVKYERNANQAYNVQELCVNTIIRVAAHPHK